MSIPKKIHYCWFGGNPLPDMAKRCIDSWKKYLPDYEIVEWNESNFDVNCCTYTKEAYASKKWAFVSDYARFKILFEEGGVYFDTDVEVIKSMDDILEKGGFMGFEHGACKLLNGDIAVAPGLGIAAEVHSALIGELMKGYHDRRFLKEDGSFNMVTIVDYATEILMRYGLEGRNEIQYVGGIYIYPTDYFGPKHYLSREVNLTPNTRSIHHYDGTWMSGKSKLFLSFKELLGPRMNKLLYRLRGVSIDGK